MNTRSNIILTGFMGTGKSTVGRALALRLGFDFVDTDHCIESRIGMTIAEFFRTEGESAFRRIESELACELADQTGLVISTGGRFMLDAGNAAALEHTGRVFCLVATPEEILRRVQQDTTVRPLLQGGNPLENIVALLKQRAAGYKRFRQISTSDKAPEQIVDEIVRAVSAEG